MRSRALFLFCILWLACGGVHAQPVKIIYDTDMDSDVDDVGALAMLHGLADMGEAEILATMVSSLNPESVSAVDVLNTYFDKPHIPIGAVKMFGVYRASKYAGVISDEFPQSMASNETAEDAAKLYRRVLSSQPDTSVVIVTVGYLTNVSNLLKTGPDDVSPLTGEELVERKVKHLVVMGGRYPTMRNPGKFGNLKPDPAASQHVAAEWPTTIIFTGGGTFARLFKTGKQTFSFDPSSNPVSRAYDAYLGGSGETRHSADQIAVYVAVRGWQDYFTLNSEGYNHIFGDGTLTWRLQPNDPRHHYVSNLRDDVDESVVTEAFEELMMTSIHAQEAD